MLNKFKMWIPVILAIGWTLYLNEWSKQIIFKLLAGDISGAYKIYEGQDENQFEMVQNQVKMFTEEELAKYTTIENGLYLSIIGQIFDVSKGEQYYSQGATYHAFIGRDASMAFITGDFSDKGLIDDTSSLTNSQAKSMNNWLKVYHKKYEYKGKLIGRYYNKNGEPTEAMDIFEQKLNNADHEEFQENQKKKMFPPCNIEWNAEKGSRVWCTNQSGGISRDWIGVPRDYLEKPNETNRCACVKLDSLEFLENKGSFREYKECDTEAVSCYIKT